MFRLVSEPRQPLHFGQFAIVGDSQADLLGTDRLEKVVTGVASRRLPQPSFRWGHLSWTSEALSRAPSLADVREADFRPPRSALSLSGCKPVFPPAIRTPQAVFAPSPKVLVHHGSRSDGCQHVRDASRPPVPAPPGPGNSLASRRRCPLSPLSTRRPTPRRTVLNMLAPGRLARDQVVRHPFGPINTNLQNGSISL